MLTTLGLKLKKKKNLAVLFPCEWSSPSRCSSSLALMLLATHSWLTLLLLSLPYISQKFPGVTYLYWSLSILCAFAYTVLYICFLFTWLIPTYPLKIQCKQDPLESFPWLLSTLQAKLDTPLLVCSWYLYLPLLFVFIALCCNYFISSLRIENVSSSYLYPSSLA